VKQHTFVTTAPDRLHQDHCYRQRYPRFTRSLL